VKLLEEKISTAVSLKNILFATDFSDASEAATPYVAAMSLRYGGLVHLAHVVPEINRVRPSAIDPVTIESIHEDPHSVAQENMLKLALRLRGFPHRTFVTILHSTFLAVAAAAIFFAHLSLPQSRF
jgi:nucleotide-binding universal stress UspA family protein